MLSERFVDALNERIAREFAAVHRYVGIGAHYAAQTFPQLSEFFYVQADEEREHAMRMVSYLVDRDANVHFGAIEEPRADFPDHDAPIRHALEQEKRVYGPDQRPVRGRARDARYQSEQFLQWFLEEQVEEEAAMSDLLEIAERTRGIPMLLEDYLARETPGKRAG